VEERAARVQVAVEAAQEEQRGRAVDDDADRGDGHPDDAFFRAAAARMRERFAIGHVTLQATTEMLMTPCDGAVAPAPRAAEHSH
jgi:hypothetical protein